MAASMDQQRWWALEQLAPDNPALNVPFAVELHGPLNVAALEKSLQAVIQRHEALRTSFAWIDGEVKQVIASEVPFTLIKRDYSAQKSERAEIIKREMLAEAQVSLTLAKAPVLRLCLVKFDANDHLLLFTLHHGICDGWSNGVILREMGLYYEGFAAGREVVLPELPIQYADYAVWQREWMTTPDFEEQLGFWEKLLAGSAPMLDFPTDQPRKGGPGHRFLGHMENYLLPLALTDKVKLICPEFSATLFMLFFANYAMLLHRYTGQTKFMVGTSMANRPRPELEGLIGQFANPMMLRIDVADNPTFRELMGRVRDMLLGAMSHQDVPLESILERIELKSSAREKPAIQAIVMFQRDFLESSKSGDLEIRPLRWVSPGTIIDLTLGIVERAEGICLHMETNPEMIEVATVQRLLRHFERLLQSIVDNPDQPISEMALITEEETAKLWNPPAALETATADPEAVTQDLLGQLEQHYRKEADPRGAVIESSSAPLLVVLDRQLRLQPPGVLGDLYVGGIDPRKVMQNQFVTGPLDVASPVPLLKTEFVAKAREDGKVVLLGKTSDIDQINGFRVNFRQIKALLYKHPDVIDSSVGIFQRTSGENYLVAYVVPRPGTSPGDKDLRAMLTGKVSDFTMPASIQVVPSLPKNSRGDVLTGLLPRPSAPKPVQGDNTPLGAILNQQLIEIWMDVLKVPAVGIDDNFFALGGTSLQGLRMMTRIEKLCGCSLPLSLLLTGATIGNLARYIISSNTQKPVPLVTVQPKGTRLPLYFLHGDWAGGGFYCSRISQQLGDDQPFYALPPYRTGKVELLKMEEEAAYHIKIIQEHSPHGPYVLGGYCIGATVVMEIARQLVAKGETVSHLLLIDPPTPISWLRHCWPAIDTLGNLLGWDLHKKIHSFDLTAVALARWMARSSSSKWDSIMRKLGLARALTDANGKGPDSEVDILKSMDYAVYFLAWRLYGTSHIAVPATVYFPEDALQSRTWLTGLAVDSTSTVLIEPLPGDHHTCITTHMPELVAKIKKTLESI